MIFLNLLQSNNYVTIANRAYENDSQKYISGSKVLTILGIVSIG